MKHTLSMLVKNRAGVVAEATDVFRRRGISFRSISCAETEDFDVSRLVLTVEDHEAELESIAEELRAHDVVTRVEDLSRRDFVDRELVLVKVGVTRATTTQVMQVCEVFRAGVIGMGQETMTVEMTGDTQKVDGFIRMLRPFGIRSLARTGVVAMKRGDDD